MLDGYCRHMGGDLTQGTVKGDEIACPFHDWRWGGDGKCKAIPYAKRIPLRARTRDLDDAGARTSSCSSGTTPRATRRSRSRTIPRIDAAYSDEWTDWTWNVLDIPNAHCREIIDNVVDMAHFFYIHYAFPKYFKNVFEGHVATQYMHSTRPPRHGRRGLRRLRPAAEVGGQLLRAVVHDQPADHDLQGLRHRGHPHQLPLPGRPTTPSSCSTASSSRSPRAVDDEDGDKIAKKYSDMFGEGFLQDVEIWKNKSPIQNPLLCEEDGPVYQLRRWYEQFYVDVADVTPEMTQRFEFEVDTTHANENWQKEVEENLRRRRRRTRSTAATARSRPRSTRP